STSITSSPFQCHPQVARSPGYRRPPTRYLGSRRASPHRYIPLLGQYMRRPTGQRLWTRDYVLAFIALLGAYIVFISLMAFMAVYATQRFGVGDTAAGFASSSFVVGAVVVRLFIGKYLNFLGRKRTLLTNLGIFVACSLLYPLTDVFSLLIVIRVVQGAAFGIISTTVTATVLDLIPVQRRSEGLGYFSLAATLGTA